MAIGSFEEESTVMRHKTRVCLTTVRLASERFAEVAAMEQKRWAYRSIVRLVSKSCEEE